MDQVDGPKKVLKRSGRSLIKLLQVEQSDKKKLENDLRNLRHLRSNEFSTENRMLLSLCNWMNGECLELNGISLKFRKLIYSTEKDYMENKKKENLDLLNCVEMIKNGENNLNELKFKKDQINTKVEKITKEKKRHFGIHLDRFRDDEIKLEKVKMEQLQIEEYYNEEKKEEKVRKLLQLQRGLTNYLRDRLSNLDQQQKYYTNLMNIVSEMNSNDSSGNERNDNNIELPTYAESVSTNH
ncbi:hypothetical protein SNEBB_002062 [Seison nebaliae]|nr:hypothetical protein SNEBB_002062 [Seison nebaliae]